MSLWKFLTPFLILLVSSFVFLRLTINFGWLSVQLIRTRLQVYEPPGAVLVLVAGLTPEGKPNPTFEVYLTKAKDWVKIDQKRTIWLFGGWEEKGLPPAWQAGKRWLIEQGISPDMVVTPEWFGERSVATTQAEVQFAVRAIKKFRVQPLVITNPLQLRRVEIMLLWHGIRPATDPTNLELVRQELGERFGKYLVYERLMWWYAVWDPTGGGLLARSEKKRRVRKVVR